MHMAPFARSASPRSPRMSRLSPGDAANDEPDPELAVRLALVGETNASNLLIWSELLQREIDICRASENYLADISPNRFEYDLLIIAGNDPKRVKRLLRCYAPAIAWKPKVALVRSSNPRERASLLRSGFDDVFEPRMPIPEAQARMRALVNRYDMALMRRASLELASVPQSGAAADAHFAIAPTARERALFDLLLSAQGSAVPSRILAAAQGTEGALKPSSVKVVVSSLRRKLRDGYEISSDRQKGYALRTDRAN
jgi:DNA-binding response OmpR family regulator